MILWSRRQRSIFTQSFVPFFCVFVAFIAAVSGVAKATEDDAATVSLEDIKASLARLQNNSELDEAAKTQASTLYTEALAEMEAADESARDAAYWKSRRLAAPEEMKQIQEELSSSLEEPKLDIAKEATSEELEGQFGQAQIDLATEEITLGQLKDAQTELKERQEKIPQSIANAKLDLMQNAYSSGDDNPEINEAQRVLQNAKRAKIAAQIDSLTQELIGLDIRERLLARRVEQSNRLLVQKQKLVKAWQEAVSRKRRDEAREANKLAREQLMQAADAGPAVRRLAEQWADQIADLVEKRDGQQGLLFLIEQANQDLGALTTKFTELSTSYDGITERHKAAGLTEAVGKDLRQYRNDLPAVYPHIKAIRERRKIISEYGLKDIQLGEELASHADNESVVADMLQGLSTDLPDGRLEKIKKLLMGLVESKRQAVEALQGDCRRYSSTLSELNTKEQEYVGKLTEFKDFIDQNVLWIRSGGPVGIGDLPPITAATTWSLEFENWQGVGRSLLKDLQSFPHVYALALLMFGGLVFLNRKLPSRLKKMGELANTSKCTSFAPTAQAIVYSLLLSVVPPALMMFVSWRLYNVPGTNTFTVAVADGLEAAAVAFASFYLPLQVLRKRGLTEHFAWPSVATRQLWRLLFLLTLVVPVIVFAITAVEQSPHQDWNETFGRACFISLCLFILVATHRALRPSRGPLWELFAVRLGSRLKIVRWTGYLAAMGMIVALGAGASLGYFYTALRLAYRIHGTLFFAGILMVVTSLLVRWLLLARRRLAITQARKRRELLKQEHDAHVAAILQDEQNELDLATVDAQTQRLLRSIIAAVFVLGLWVIWSEEIPALRILEDKTVWGTTSVSWLDVALASLIAIVTTVMAKNVPGLLEIAVLQRTSLLPGERQAVTTILRYILVSLGIFLSLNTVGIDWSKLQWLVAALGLGLGFGLQEIFANFISGVILLFERPIRVGDTVTVGGISGTVTGMRLRATSITDWDRKELIVPNKEFITGQLVNWTLSDQTLRQVISVGIAYDSDVELAEEILYKIAREHPHVLAEPAPVVIFKRFGESTLDYELRVFCAAEHGLTLKHEIHKSIFKQFQQAGIVIAFPQREVRVISQAMPPSLQDKEARKLLEDRREKLQD